MEDISFPSDTRRKNIGNFEPSSDKNSSFFSLLALTLV